MPVSVLHVVGARPNFPKMAPVVRALDEHSVSQQIVHTGQHYDDALSDVFFRQLDLPAANYTLATGSGSHAEQTAAILVGLERVFIQSRPALVVAYGDVNSALAAALAAAKLTIPLAHVEAGLRSWDRAMPEEINRIVVDRLAQLHFSTSVDAVAQLGNEGIAPSMIHFVGNPMVDSLLVSLPRCDGPAVRRSLSLPDRYAVVTVHRPSNVDEESDVVELVKALHAVADQIAVVVPLHPRGRASLTAAGLLGHPRIMVSDPLGYLEFIALMREADVVVTDSGGVQEETTVLGVPCLTLRPNTERPATISHGTNRLTTSADLAIAVADTLRKGRPASWPKPPLWDGKAGLRIAAVIAEFLSEATGEPAVRTAGCDGSDASAS